MAQGGYGINILFFLTGPIFKKVGQKVFESKYFNCFRHVELQKGMKLFEKGSGSDISGLTRKASVMSDYSYQMA